MDGEGAGTRIFGTGQSSLHDTGLALGDDGASALRGAITLRAPSDPDDGLAAGSALVSGPRVGITRGAELRYRFYLRDSPWVSPWRSGGRVKPGSKV